MEGLKKLFADPKAVFGPELAKLEQATRKLEATERAFAKNVARQEVLVDTQVQQVGQIATALTSQIRQPAQQSGALQQFGIFPPQDPRSWICSPIADRNAGPA